MTAASDISAFPATRGQFNEVGGQIESVGGLTKREYFAGLAMQGLLTNVPADQPIRHTGLAIESCELADTLIAVLNEQPRGGE